MKNPMPQPAPIMQRWLPTREVGSLLRLTGDAIKRRIYRGVYKKVRRVRGRGGRAIWEIDVYDENLPPEIGMLYELQTQPPQPQCFSCVRQLQLILGELKADRAARLDLLKHVGQVLRLLKEINEKP